MSIPTSPSSLAQKPTFNQSSSQKKNPKIETLKKFFKKHQERIILTAGAILIAVLAFLAGRLSTNQSFMEDKKSLRGEVKIPIKKEIQEDIKNDENITENEEIQEESNNNIDTEIEETEN